MGAAAAVCGLTLSGLAATTAHSAVDIDCPRATGGRGLVEGEPVNGLTVSHGTKPDKFTGEYVGSIESGIAPGVDMLIVQLSGSRITKANGEVDAGIWSGMSGSPVYDARGRLIGAVAYGLSWAPSDMAGVTPARAMYDLRVEIETPPKVTVPTRLAKELVAEGDATRAQVESGFKRLRMPINVSGVSTSRLHKLAKRADINPRRFVGGGSGSSTAEKKHRMKPGGNVGASLSYGDVTQAGIGTVTAICDGQVLAFGHPMMFSGDSNLSMHGAKALFVQRDPTFGSFKVANLGAPVGGIVQDRLAAILGFVNQQPETTAITSLTRSAGRKRTGATYSSVSTDLPFTAAIHVLVNADRVFDQVGPGTSRLKWSVAIQRANGKTLFYHRADRLASPYDVTMEAAFDVLDDLYRLQENRFEEIEITGIHTQLGVSPDFKALVVKRAEYRAGGRWLGLDRRTPLVRRAGTTVLLRVRLEPYRGSELAGRWVRTSFHIPDSADDRRGTLTIRGGQSIWSFGSGGASNLKELVQVMEAAPRNDHVVSTLSLAGRPGFEATTTKRKAGVVVGGLRVRVYTR